jgi:hypothetical protein
MLRDLIDVGQLARAYDVPVIDYERPGYGLLITCGAGLLLAGMDAIPECRWVLSSEGLKEIPPQNWRDFMDAAGMIISVLAVYTLFGMDIPEPVTALAGRVSPARVCWYSNRWLGHVGAECPDLDTLAETAHQIAGYRSV